MYSAHLVQQVTPHKRIMFKETKEKMQKDSSAKEYPHKYSHAVMRLKT